MNNGELGREFLKWVPQGLPFVPSLSPADLEEVSKILLANNRRRARIELSRLLTRWFGFSVKERSVWDERNEKIGCLVPVAKLWWTIQNAEHAYKELASVSGSLRRRGRPPKAGSQDKVKQTAIECLNALKDLWSNSGLYKQFQRTVRELSDPQFDWNVSVRTSEGIEEFSGLEPTQDELEEYVLIVPRNLTESQVKMFWKDVGALVQGIRESNSYARLQRIVVLLRYLFSGAVGDVLGSVQPVFCKLNDDDGRESAGIGWPANRWDAYLALAYALGSAKGLRYCKNCGRPFILKNHKKIFCLKPCCDAYWYRNSRGGN